ncbi:alpha-ribazole phosphatase [Chloroflexota bacterium]
MSCLILIRHGNTELNSASRFCGQNDTELSVLGINQAEQLGERLAVEKANAVYSSDLCRAAKTAGMVAQRHRLDVTICPELREINFGVVDGLTFEETSQLYPGLTKSWFTRDLDFHFPNGESVSELNNRVHKFIPRLQEHVQTDTILIVAHGGVLKLMICHLLGLEPWHWRQFRLDLASISVIETYPELAVMKLLNDTTHLRV